MDPVRLGRADAPFVVVEEYVHHTLGLTGAYDMIWLHPPGTYEGRAVRHAQFLGAAEFCEAREEERQGYTLHDLGLWREPFGTALIEAGVIVTSSGVLPALRGDRETDVRVVVELLLERRGVRR